LHQSIGLVKSGVPPMQRNQVKFLFLNIGHFLDHLFMLVFASVAVFQLNSEWGMSYAALIPYATPGFIAFGVCALLAGWIADKWSREGMIVIFFIGIGASSILTGMANNPLQIALGLTLVGIFAAIYHPVGLAMVVHGRKKTGIPLAINGIFGNMGVASAALLTGFLVDSSGWRSAFFVPGIISILLGIAYLVFIRSENQLDASNAAAGKATETPSIPRHIFQRMGTATMVGWYAFLVFSTAAFAQLLVGYLVDHHSIRTVFATIAILQAMLFFLMIHLEGVAALLVAFAFMFVVFGQIPINDVLIGRMARSEWRSRVYALRYIVTFSVMASTVPLISWVHENWGFEKLFVILTIAALAIFAATLVLPKSSSIIQQQKLAPASGT